MEQRGGRFYRWELLQMNIYFEPEKFGLETFGEIQWGEPCYSFNLTVVWRRNDDGAFLFGDDSGCSCPAPFENVALTDLTVIESIEHLKAHLESRDNDPWITGGRNQSDDIAGLLERMHAAGLR